MVDAVATARLASYCDVFVDDGYFSAEQGKRILGRAKAAGLATKVHADELADSGGAALAADLGRHPRTICSIRPPRESMHSRGLRSSGSCCPRHLWSPISRSRMAGG